MIAKVANEGKGKHPYKHETKENFKYNEEQLSETCLLLRFIIPKRTLLNLGLTIIKELKNEIYTNKF